MYYLQTRYYDPEIGRFMTIDAIEYVSAEPMSGHNLYAYCGNNPVMNVDPTGHSVIVFFVLLALGAIAGGTVFGKIAYDNRARGLELFGRIALGVAVGIAAMGAIISIVAVFAGAFGVTSILGVATSQVFAIGALAFDSFGVLVAPILGVTMQLIEFGDDSYEKPIPNSNPNINTPLAKYQSIVCI